MFNLVRKIDAPKVSVRSILDQTNELRHLVSEFNGLGKSARKDFLREQINERFENLIARLLDAYPYEHIRITDIKKVFERHYALTESELMRLPESVVPLVIVRELLSKQQLRVKPSAIKRWGEFAFRYKEALAV